MSKYFAFELAELPGRPLRDWGKYRSQDNAYSALWLCKNRTGDASLLKLVKLLHDRPKSAWNYALELGDCATKVEDSSIGDVPF